jgi:predicted transcriptional regulator
MAKLTSRKIDPRELRKIMIDRGIYAREVAKVLKVKPQTVRCYMCGTRGMTQRQLERVQTAFEGAP